MRHVAAIAFCSLLLTGCSTATDLAGLAFIGIHEIGGSRVGTVRTCTDDGCSRSSVYKRGDTYTVHTD